MGIQSAITSSVNSVVNQSTTSSMPSGILQAIKSAASRTGVDFSYLVKKAAQESGFDATAKAASSSATGLYQFTSQTWLQMVKTYGAQYGMGSYASQITTDSSGHLSVSDPATKQAILNLRNDPQASAMMAAQLDKENAASLQSTVGGKINGTDLYLAHFLGASGASDFLTTMQSTPNASAASVLPAAAAANPSVFYSANGQPRSLEQVYQHFAQTFNGPTQVASAAAAPTTVAAASISATGATSLVNASANAAITTHILTASFLPKPKSAVYSETTADATPASSAMRAATTGAGGINLSGSSTLFATMILGQMGGISAASPTTTAAALAQTSDKKKDAISVLSAAA